MNVIDWEYTDGGTALCPFTDDACKMECMLMRPTGFGEPRCSIRVIADELVLFDKKHSGAVNDAGKSPDTESFRAKADIFDFDGLVTVDDALAVQRACDAASSAYGAIASRLPRDGEPFDDGWVRDDLTEEEWQAKPLVQKLFDAHQLLAWCIVEIDPGGTLRNDDE